MIYLANLNLNQNELQNAIIQPLATPPTNPKLGQIYTDSVNNRIKWWNGSEWKVVGVVVEASTANGSIKVDGVEMTVYTLPKTSTTVLGGMKVGSGLIATDEGVVSVDVVNNLTSDDTTKPLSAAMGKSLKESINKITTDIGDLGGGDMMKATYDSNDNGVVDDSEKLGGQLPSYYAKAIDIPTKLSELTNDENFIDNTVNNLLNYYTKSETFTKTEVNNLIGGLATIQISVVESLPATGDSNIIYLVAKETADGAQNVYDEYLWTGSKFERIGDTTVDLTNYLTKTGDASNVTVTFTQASTRTNVTTGDALNIIIGKISKYFSDLKTVAFTGKYTDLTDTPVIDSVNISIGTTSVTVTTPKEIKSYMAIDNTTGEQLFIDMVKSVDASNNKYVFSISEAYTNIVKITYIAY